MKTLEEVLNQATTPTEHRVQAFSSWGNLSQPAYTTHGEKANILMRIRIDPNNQRILKTQRLDNSCHNKDYSNKITDNNLKTNQRCLLQNVNNEYSRKLL